MKKEEEEFNSILEKQSKDYYDEKIGMKETLKKFKPFKDTYFTKIKNDNTKKYNEEMLKFKKDLEKQVQEDIYKELKEEFKKDFDDFKKKKKKQRVKIKKVKVGFVDKLIIKIVIFIEVQIIKKLKKNILNL